MTKSNSGNSSAHRARSATSFFSTTLPARFALRSASPEMPPHLPRIYSGRRRRRLRQDPNRSLSMASLVWLAPRNLRQRFRWRRPGVDYLAPTQARRMGISNGAAKSASITADGTSALNRALTSSRLHSSMEDVPMFIWIGIATAFVACLAVMIVVAARAPIMDVDPDLEERAERIAEREAWLKSRKRGAAPVVKAHE